MDEGRIVLVRHGETAFTHAFERGHIEHGLRDPALTATGRAQAARAADSLRGLHIGHIVASPLTRTLETALIISRVLEVRVHVCATLRERRYYDCDIGLPRSALLSQWPTFTFADFSEEWWAREREPHTEFVERLRHTRAKLAAWSRHGKVCVVTHAGVIEALSGARPNTGGVVALPAWPPSDQGGTGAP